MTKEEIDSLIKFGKELDRRVTELRIQQSELSRRTAVGDLNPISQGYISDILRVGRGDSKKYFRLHRDKVIRLANAVEWPVEEALDFAGFQSSHQKAGQEAKDTQQSADFADLIQSVVGVINKAPLNQRRRLLEAINLIYEDHQEDFYVDVRIDPPGTNIVPETIVDPLAPNRPRSTPLSSPAQGSPTMRPGANDSDTGNRVSELSNPLGLPKKKSG